MELRDTDTRVRTTAPSVNAAMAIPCQWADVRMTHESQVALNCAACGITENRSFTIHRRQFM